MATTVMTTSPTAHALHLSPQCNAAVFVSASPKKAASLKTSPRKRASSSDHGPPALDASPHVASDDETLDAKDENSEVMNELKASVQSIVPSESKRSRHEVVVQLMPKRYETCDVKLLGRLIADMLLELIRLNDGIPLKDGQLTRFHSR